MSSPLFAVLLLLSLLAGCASPAEKVGDRIAAARSLDEAMRCCADAELPPAPSWFTMDRSFTYNVGGHVSKVLGDVVAMQLDLPPDWHGDARLMVFDVASQEGWHRAVVLGAWCDLWLARVFSHPVARDKPSAGDRVSVDYSASSEIRAASASYPVAGQQAAAADAPQAARR